MDKRDYDSMTPQPGDNDPRKIVPPKAIHDAPIPSLPVPPLVDDADMQEDEDRFLTPGNMIMLGMIAALVVFLLYKFTFEQMWNIAKAALGLSFVIFVHELGHFLAAKWCDVNVTTFSIGFGPAIPGCRFKWGETTYKLAILPLGGYVQMVGQIDGDEASDGSEEDPRSYRRKSVSQRMLIISAGVIMNALLAIACFITIYQGPGKDHPAAVISLVDSGAPSYKHGLRSGAAITEIGSIKNPTFTELTQTVINSMEGEPIPVVFERPGHVAVSTQIEPVLSKSEPKKPVIGVAPPSALRFIAKRNGQEGPYLAGTPAANPSEGKFEFGDVIVAMTDPAKNYEVTPLRDDPRFPGHGQCDYFEFTQRLQLLMDKDIVLRVRRGTPKESKEYDVKVGRMYRLNLGIRMQMGSIAVVREGSAAAGKVRAPDPAKKLDADLIEAVRVTDVDGKTLSFKDKTLDPERLPLQLRQWSDRMAKEMPQEKLVVTLQLRRHRGQPGIQYEQVEAELAWDKDWRFDRVVPVSPDAPIAIPELGIGYLIKTEVADATQPNSPFKAGDVIKNIRYDVDGTREEVSWLRDALQQMGLVEEANTDIEVRWMGEDLEASQWAYMSYGLFSQPFKFKKIVFKVERDKKIIEVDLPLSEDISWPLEERGWQLGRDMRQVKATGPLNAIWMGMADTYNRMMEVFQNLRGMITGRISVRNLGGPLTIAYGTYRFAGMDFADFVFFLGLISINLAVVNFLPIPVLDGGHMVFLIYEKIRGQPASEGVRIAATYVGLAMILCLMFFVLYLDVSRLFF